MPDRDWIPIAFLVRALEGLDGVGRNWHSTYLIHAAGSKKIMSKASERSQRYHKCLREPVPESTGTQQPPQ